MKRNIVLFFLAITSRIGVAQDINIIPQPSSVQQKQGRFIIKRTTPIVAKSPEEIRSGKYLNAYLNKYFGFSLPIKTSGSAGIIIKANKDAADSYVLEVDPKSIKVLGGNATGAFYGIQTVLQLLPLEKNGELSIPAVSITDTPVNKYRGLMLDVGRHFFPVADVKRYIDLLALHKMNYFHWHLTEDQGWRIEIKKYPKLTSVGAWRNGTIIGNNPGTGNTNTRYGGYYTQEEVKDVVKYAADRYITVIPEIEMPGHSSAAIASYPYLSCFPDKPTIDYVHKKSVWSGDSTGKQVIQAWGIYKDVFCAGKETTFQFLTDVLDEVMSLFPAKIIHIGGDECPKSNWEACPNCQKRIAELGFKTDSSHKAEHYLQSYFVKRIEQYLNGKGRKLLGWDEILEGGLAPNAWVMSWRGEKGGIEAARSAHNVVMTPNTYAYFDHQQAEKEDSVTITKNRKHLPIEKVYGWNVYPDSLQQEYRKYVQGGQANLWTEYVTNPGKAEYMLLPRLAALCESLWTAPAKKQWSDFNTRLQVQKKRYSLWGYNYYGK
ncbi:beta-N-acetylhexosaminidase [Longitalea luteola]|uniref:beta-N-acetylhexosaminidase n=1 Tax=Longitalea luteola TaxID=2812563 RepID=UPI001A960F91|nr:beta-N-acetylhexosaminidase [Longitalea luteola]